MKKHLLFLILLTAFSHQLAAQAEEAPDSIAAPVDTILPAPVVTDTIPATDTLNVQVDSLNVQVDTSAAARDSLERKPPGEEEKKPVEPTGPRDKESSDVAPPKPKPAVSPPSAPKSRLSSGQFEVLMTKGAIMNGRTGRKLQAKSILDQKDPLRFSGADNRLALIDERKNLFIARPRSNLTQYDLQPTREKLSTRPGKILNYIGFVKYLEGRDFLVLGGRAGIEVGAEEFPMDQNHFFYLRYRWTGDANPINKKLSHEGTTLFFDRDEIYRVDDRPIDPARTSNFELYYYDAVDNTSTLINALTLVFPDETEVRDAVQVLIDHFGTFDREGLYNAIESFLFTEYGVPEKQNLAGWLLRNFGLATHP